MRNIYLKTLPLEEAKKLFQQSLESFFENKETEVIPTREALGRVSSRGIYAKLSSPSFHSCAMDGIMVQSSLTLTARDQDPVFLKEGDYKICDTGDPLVSPYDAVIMVEDLLEEKDGSLRILKPVHPWEHVRPIGEDIIENNLLFTARHRFTPVDLSVLLAAGIQKVEVIGQPTLAIIPTGDEIVSGDETLKLGEIIESNSAMFEAMAREAGAKVHRFPIVKDKKNELIKTVQDALKHCDVITMIAGSSAGRDDLTADIVKELGEVLVHGVAIRPGKPVVLGVVKEKPFIGLPGYPVSAHIVFEEFVTPLLRKKGLLPEKKTHTVEATLTRRVVSSLKNREYLRVKVGKVDGKYIATPMERGAGASMSLALSDGYLIVPQMEEGVESGETVTIQLHRPLDNIDNHLVSIGSHDMLLDYINDMMARKELPCSLISTHVGSFAGLQSLLQKECHLAPTHLLGKDGNYNNEAISMFFKNQKIALIKVAGRKQGIIVPKGNPKNIQSLRDLKGLTMINRQRGAGTRVLFDELVKKEGLTSKDFPGYEKEATTHLAVALAVKNEDVDFGIGIEQAAKNMDCDFIYLADEEYELATYPQFLSHQPVKVLLQLLESEEYREAVRNLGGYEVSESGRVRYVE